MSTYGVHHRAFNANAQGVKRKKDRHTPMSTYGVHHRAFNANAWGENTICPCEHMRCDEGHTYAYVSVWGTWVMGGASRSMPTCGMNEMLESILTISATRAAVSKRVGKSSFSMKELTEGVCLKALDKCRHMRILSGSPGAWVWIETMNGED